VRAIVRLAEKPDQPDTLNPNHGAGFPQPKCGETPIHRLFAAGRRAESRAAVYRETP